MEGDRKYQQRGYNESSRQDNNGNGGSRGDRPRPQGPRQPIDVTGPRLPHMVQAVAASRCNNCATMLPPGIDFDTKCPKCDADLHCCKQCTYFEPSTRFQCRKPIPVRISPKDKRNECELFKERVTVARDSVEPQHRGMGSGGMGSGGFGSAGPAPRDIPSPRNSQDARAAFDNLFKDSDSTEE